MKAENLSDRTTLRMLNAEGEAVTNAPAQMELRRPSGDRLRYRVGNTNLPEVAALPEYLFYDHRLGIWRDPQPDGDRL